MERWVDKYAGGQAEVRKDTGTYGAGPPGLPSSGSAFHAGPGLGAAPSWTVPLSLRVFLCPVSGYSPEGLPVFSSLPLRTRVSGSPKFFYCTHI